MKTSSHFVGAEHSKRMAAYQSSPELQGLMERMNAALEPIERYQPSGVARPNLFIFGLPRSGTTLLYQLAARCFDIGYINNVSARFWLAPLTGVAFAQSLLGERRDSSFTSDYGKSVDLSGPHEFSYFWQRWLRMTDIESACRFGGPGDGIDWTSLVSIIGCLQDRFGAAMVHKTNYVANLMPDFARQLPMPIFVYIERDCADVALSILKARRIYYGDNRTWWATYPPTYAEVKDLPFAQQIGRQVRDLRAVYERSMGSVPQDLVVRLSYSELCESPRVVLRAIQQRVAQTYGFDLGILDGVPESFPLQRCPEPKLPDELAVLTELRELGLVA